MLVPGFELDPPPTLYRSKLLELVALLHDPEPTTPECAFGPPVRDIAAHHTGDVGPAKDPGRVLPCLRSEGGERLGGKLRVLLEEPLDRGSAGNDSTSRRCSVSVCANSSECQAS